MRKKKEPLYPECANCNVGMIPYEGENILGYDIRCYIFNGGECPHDAAVRKGEVCPDGVVCKEEDFTVIKKEE